MSSLARVLASILLSLLPVFQGWAAPILYPMADDTGKWGFIAEDGKWVIQPQFEFEWWGVPCIDEVMPVKLNGAWGVIERSGTFVVPPNYDKILPSSHLDTSRILRLENGPLQGFVSRDGCHVFLGADELGNFREGLAWVRKGKYVGLVRDDTTWLIAPEIEWGAENPLPRPLEDGLSWFDHDRDFGLITREGRVLFKPVFNAKYTKDKYGNIEEYDLNWTGWKDGLTWVQKGKSRWMIDLAGKVVKRENGTVVVFSPSPTDEVHRRERLGNLVITRGGRWGDRIGLADIRGKILQSPRFKWVGEFHEDLAMVSEDDGNPSKIGFINQMGELVTEPQYSYASKFYHGVAWVMKSSGLKEWGWGLIDQTGSVILEPEYRLPNWKSDPCEQWNAFRTMP